MKPEFAEKLFVESLVKQSLTNNKSLGSDIGTIEKLTGDASTRRYYRIAVDEINYVVCLDNPTKTEQEKNEFVEVQRVLEKQKIRVPKIYDCDLEKGYILEEDLGNCTFLKSVGMARPVDERGLYEKAVEQLIQMQSINIDSYLDNTFAKLQFDIPKLMSEVDFSTKYFIKNFLGHTLSKKDSEIINNAFGLISKKLATQRKVFTHRDYHSRNIMIKNNEQIIIDFQDARLGIPQYDLVSLLEDCYFDVPHKTTNDLKEIFWTEFIKPKKLQSSLSEFELLYDYMAIQRIYKAIGSFSYIFSTRDDYRYLKYIGFSFENLRYFISRHSELSELRSLLGSIYYES